MLTVTGPVEELEAELRNIAEGCLGRERFIEEAAEGVRRLKAGDSSVRVGHTVYVVTGG